MYFIYVINTDCLILHTYKYFCVQCLFNIVINRSTFYVNYELHTSLLAFISMLKETHNVTYEYYNSKLQVPISVVCTLSALSLKTICISQVFPHKRKPLQKHRRFTFLT